MQLGQSNIMESANQSKQDLANEVKHETYDNIIENFIKNKIDIMKLYIITINALYNLYSSGLEGFENELKELKSNHKDISKVNTEVKLFYLQECLNKKLNKKENEILNLQCHFLLVNFLSQICDMLNQKGFSDKRISTKLNEIKKTSSEELSTLEQLLNTNSSKFSFVSFLESNPIENNTNLKEEEFIFMFLFNKIYQDIIMRFNAFIFSISEKGNTKRFDFDKSLQLLNKEMTKTAHFLKYRYNTFKNITSRLLKVYENKMKEETITRQSAESQLIETQLQKEENKPTENNIKREVDNKSMPVVHNANDKVNQISIEALNIKIDDEYNGLVLAVTSEGILNSENKKSLFNDTKDPDKLTKLKEILSNMTEIVQYFFLLELYSRKNFNNDEFFKNTEYQNQMVQATKKQVESDHDLYKLQLDIEGKTLEFYCDGSVKQVKQTLETILSQIKKDKRVEILKKIIKEIEYKDKKVQKAFLKKK